MDLPQEVELTFVDGVAVGAAGVDLYLGCGFPTLDVQASRMLLLRSNGKWGHHDVHARVRSVDISESPFGFYSLSGDGVVSVGSMQGINFERIADAGTGAGKFGYVKRIKKIGDSLYVCGDQRQVYVRVGARWQHLDADILMNDPLAVGVSLNDIGGTDERNIYAVGDRGVIFHYDGSRWANIASPTNRNLERIFVRSRDEIYICGDATTLLKGSNDKWNVIETGFDLEETFWGVAFFQGAQYLATEHRIVRLDDNGLSVVDTGIPTSGSYHRLSATSEKLWSIGVNDLAFFDGRQWTRVEYPPNR
jgi:hypothetical protein